MYAAARSLANEPVMLSQLVVLAIEGLSAECTCNALSARQFPGEDLDRIAALATSGDIRDSYYRAVVGEAAFGLFDNSPTNPLSNPLSMFDRHAYVDAIEAVLDTADLPLRDAITAVRALDIYPDMTGPRPVAGQSTYYARLHPFSSILIPPMLRTFGAAARGEIYRELVHLITAIESYRLEHNAPPENLDQLVPDYLETLPQDPYSNVTYQYLPTNPGYAVYSLGPNRQDDQAEKLTNTTGDINLRITR